MQAISTPPHPPKMLDSPPLSKHNNVGITRQEKTGRIVEHFWGFRCAKIAQLLAAKAL